MIASSRPPNLLLRMLDVADFDLLRPHLSTTELARETVLFRQGEPLTQVYFPHGGAVSIMVALDGRQTIEVAMLGHDSLIGGGTALADGTAVADAVVLFPATASVLDLAAFRNIADRSIGFRHMVLRHEQVLFACAQQSLICNTLHLVEARLARWLLRARDLCERETLPLTQQLLAQMMGVKRNAVSIVAHTLQQDGTIRYSRGRIEIIDGGALMQTTCECYSTVRAHYERLLRRR